MREITGKHVLIGTVSAFTVIIGVNVFMAVQAVRTFPGLEGKNSYVASQTFDHDNPVQAAEMGGTLGRATNVVEDQTPEFTFNGEAYVAETGELAEGNWNYRMVATAQDGTPFKQRVIIHVKR